MIRIGFIGFDGVVGIDLAGPIDAFADAALEEGRNTPVSCYDVVVIGLTKKPFVSESGMIFTPQRTVRNAPPLDTLIIPGGSGLRKKQTADAVSAFVRERAPSTRRIASICTGIYGLAQTGLLAGRKVTTHWRFTQDVARRFPDLRVQDNAIFLKDGKYYTSAGATTGIDLSLYLIEEDYGPRVALRVARDLVVYLKRAGGQEQYSEPLQFQTKSIDRFAELTTWMVSHLCEELSVPALAAKACLSPRQFTRRFSRAFGYTPGEFVEKLRLDEARHRLSTVDNSIENVGLSVGFKSADAFRRAFERRLGVTPGEYRRRFSNGSRVRPNERKRHAT